MLRGNATSVILNVMIFKLCDRELQPRKYQLSNSQVSDISKSVVKDKKLSSQHSSRCNLNIEKSCSFL